MQILIQKVESSQKRQRPTDESKLGFGTHFSDHMFLMNFGKDRGWHEPRIEPYGPLSLEPAASVFHYAQEIFEGLKAYRRADGGIQLFRARENLKRMNRSAARLCMPALDEDFVFGALKELLGLDQEWVPRTQGASLYVRPTMIATDPFLGVRPSSSYLFFVITGPVGAYYAEGFNPTKILVTDQYVRACSGGVGAIKAGGNYAASLLAAEKAYEKGYTQVLWLDALEHKYVEEVGTSNIFFFLEDQLITPPLAGTILPGVTRDSVIRLARDWGIAVEERSISILEVLEFFRNGHMKEIFATGTAAVISPVGQICYKEELFTVNDGKVGELSQRLYEEITGIQYGERPDPHGWIETVG